MNSTAPAAALIDRYIAKLVAVPLAASLIVAAMLLLVDKMRRLLELVAQEGGPVSVVWRMVAHLIPEYLSLGIPIGLLLGILLAFRRLATSSELDVLLAVGIPYRRLLRVPFLYATVLAFVNLALVGFIQPYARYAYEGLRYDLRSGALGASIKVGEFTKLGRRMTLRVESRRARTVRPVRQRRFQRRQAARRHRRARPLHGDGRSQHHHPAAAQRHPGSRRAGFRDAARPLLPEPRPADRPA